MSSDYFVRLIAAERQLRAAGLVFAEIERALKAEVLLGEQGHRALGLAQGAGETIREAGKR